MSSAAQRGALFLDKNQSGWWEKIDVNRLNMRVPEKCVLGQLYEGYRGGLRQLEITSRAKESRLGFRISRLGRLLMLIRRNSWGLLTKAWKQEIADRR